MSKKSRGSKKAVKARRSAYKDRALSNRIRRLTRHLKNHPEDKQAAKARANPTVRSGRRSLRRFITRIRNIVMGTGKSQWFRVVKISRAVQQSERQVRFAELRYTEARNAEDKK